MIALLFAFATAYQIRGTVVDPHQRPVAGAMIAIACADLKGTVDTNESGGFEIEIAAAGSCEIRVSHPGFETLTRPIAAPVRTPLAFQLSPAHWEERVDVSARRLTPAQAATDALSGATLIADAMRVAGPDSARWLALAQRSAGQPLGSYALTVNGMPTSLLPLADAITSIAAAVDPFSVEVVGADRVMLEVTSEPPRRWQFDISPGVFTSRQHDVLLPDASYRSQHRTFGAGGPLTSGGGVRAQASASTSRARRQPTYVEHVPSGDRLAASLDSIADAAAWTGEISARRGAWEWHGSLSRSRSMISNGGIGGRSGPAGALDIESATRRVQATWRRAGPRVVFRGGIAFEREHHDTSSPASGAGYVFADSLVAGAPDTLATSSRLSATTIRALAASSDAPVRGWLIGLETATEGIAERRLFNSSGVFFAAGPFDLTGPRLVRFSQLTARVSTQRFSAFGQRVIAATNRVWARIGVRTEWQREFGITVSPRLAIGVQAGRFLIGGNVGMFSDLWPASDQLERSFRLAVPAFIESGAASLPLLFEGDGARRTDTVLRASVIRPFRGGRIGVDETVRIGAHLLGLTRRLDTNRLIDVMDHSRSLVRRQTRVRLDLARRGWSASGFYEHTSAIDDTDGPFSLAATSGDIARERGPSSAIPAHALTGMLAGAMRGVRVLVSARLSSGTPYSLLTGADPDRLFTFNGRAGEARNLERSPASSDVSAYLARQVHLPIARLNLDLGVRLENVLGALTPLEVERSAASALAGRPVRAARGRSISFWTTWGLR